MTAHPGLLRRIHRLTMYSLYAFIYDVFFVVDDEKHYLPKNTSVKTVCPSLLRRIHRSLMYSSRCIHRIRRYKALFTEEYIGKDSLLRRIRCILRIRWIHRRYSVIPNFFRFLHRIRRPRPNFFQKKIRFASYYEDFANRPMFPSHTM